MSDATIVIGGGPAGAAAAIGLARAGRAVRVLERQSEIGDAICGGFLSWRTLRQLELLGIEVDALGGQRVTHLALFAGERRAVSRLPHAAMGVSRRRLDTLMLEQATACGARIELGVKVRGIDEQGRIDCGDAGTIAADALILATGKYELPGAKRAMPARLTDDPVLGLRVRAAPSAGFAVLVGDGIELHLFERGYAGIVRQEDGGGNICMAVRKSLLSEAGGSPAALLAALASRNPRLAERLAHVTDLSAADAIAAVPYGFIARAAEPGRFRIGDQAAVIPSLAGEGIGIALASARAAVAALLRGGPDAAARYQADFAARAALPMRIAGAAWRAAEHRGLARAGIGAARLFPVLPRAIARATRIA